MSEPRTPGERLSAAAIVRALADADSRAICRATATGPKTVAEIVEACGIPTATAYRKVDRLADVGLLTEDTRVRPDGRHPATFQLRDVTISMTITDSIGLEIECSPAVRHPPRTRSVGGADGELPVTLVTDGGDDSLEAASPGDHDRFRRLFVDVTGTEEVVIEQELDGGFRDLDAASASLSTYVTAVTKDDGLGETFDEPNARPRRDRRGGQY